MLSDVIEHWKNLPVHTITEKNINTNNVDDFFTWDNLPTEPSLEVPSDPRVELFNSLFDFFATRVTKS